MTNYNQLNINQRETIQVLINKGKSFKDVGDAIGKNRTTVSKESRRNRYIKSDFYEPFDQEGILKAISKCDRLKKKPCNMCHNKKYCTNHHIYYDFKLVQKNYEKNLINSRSDVDINPNSINAYDLYSDFTVLYMFKLFLSISLISIIFVSNSLFEISLKNGKATVICGSIKSYNSSYFFLIFCIFSIFLNFGKIKMFSSLYLCNS